MQQPPSFRARAFSLPLPDSRMWMIVTQLEQEGALMTRLFVSRRFETTLALRGSAVMVCLLGSAPALAQPAAQPAPGAPPETAQAATAGSGEGQEIVVTATK